MGYDTRMAKINIEQGMQELIGRDLLTHDAAHLVRSIEPGEVNTVATVLLWSSFEVIDVVEPPEFHTALISRLTNIGDAFRWLEGVVDRPRRIKTWSDASRIVDELPTPELNGTRAAINRFLKSTRSVDQ